MAEPIFSVKNLSKSYPAFSLKGVSFELKRGSILGLVGANGAGKSTTIRCITGQTPFSQGEVRLRGLDLKTDQRKFKSKIAYLAEDTDIYLNVKAKDLYDFVRSLYESWEDERFKALIERFDLDLEQKMGAYSKGMKLKFHLALALSRQASILIMDEPTSGLDPVIRSFLLEILSEEVKTNGSALLFSTHITEDLQKIATDVCFIADGAIILNDKTSNLREQYIECREFSHWQNILPVDTVHRVQNRLIMNRSERVLTSLHKRGIEYSDIAFDDLLIALLRKGGSYV